MTYIERLIKAGLRPECAIDTVAWYRMQSDENSLEKYTQALEERADKSCAV